MHITQFSRENAQKSVHNIANRHPAVHKLDKKKMLRYKSIDHRYHLLGFIFCINFNKLGTFPTQNIPKYEKLSYPGAVFTQHYLHYYTLITQTRNEPYAA